MQRHITGVAQITATIFALTRLAPAKAFLKLIAMDSAGAAEKLRAAPQSIRADLDAIWERGDGQSEGDVERYRDGGSRPDGFSRRQSQALLTLGDMPDPF